MLRVHIGRMLELEGLLDAEGVRHALDRQRAWGGRFGRACLDLRLVSEPQLTELLGRQLALPVVKLAGRHVPPYVISRLPRTLIRERCVLPLEVVRSGRAARLVVAFATPDDLELVDAVSFAAGMPVQVVLAGEDDLRHAIERHLDGQSHVVAGADTVELPDAPLEPMQLVDGRTLACQ